MRKPVNILYLRDTTRVCGPGKTIINTCRTIDRNKWNIIVAATKSNENKINELLVETTKLGIISIPLHIGRFLNLHSIIDLIKIIKDYKINIIQSHDSQTRRLATIASLFTGIIHITSLHGWIQNDLKAKISVYIDKYLLRFAKRIIVMSNAMKIQLVSVSLPKRKLLVIHNSIMLEDYPIYKDNNNLRRELNIASDKVLIAIIGRLSNEKGHDIFIKAANEIVKYEENVRFIIVGDGNLLDKLKSDIAKLEMDKYIYFTGHRNDLENIYPSIDILAITSYTEGLPNVMLEAFAYSKPVVATDVGGISEVVEEGINGYLIEPGDIEQLVFKLNKLINNEKLRKIFGEKGREKIIKEFNFINRTKKLEDLYKTLIVEHIN